jgi:hypothetical protein
MLDRTELDKIEKIEVPEPESSGLLRLVLNSNAAFSDWTARVRTYLERSISFDEDAPAAAATLRWIYSPLHGWPANHSRFVSDGILVCGGVSNTLVLPTGLSDILTAVQDVVDNETVAFATQDSSSTYDQSMQSTIADHSNLVIDGDRPNANGESNPTANHRYSFTGHTNTEYSFTTRLRTIKVKCNNLMKRYADADTDYYTTTNRSVPSVAGPIIVKLYLILKFLRDEVSPSSSGFRYVAETDWTNGGSTGIADVAATFMGT